MYSYRNVFRGCHRIDLIILYANAEACAECISILTYGYIIDMAEKKVVLLWRLVAPMQNEPVVSDLLVDTGNSTFCLSAPSSFSLPHSVPAMLFQEIKTVAWHIQPPCTCRKIHLI